MSLLACFALFVLFFACFVSKIGSHLITQADLTWMKLTLSTRLAWNSQSSASPSTGIKMCATCPTCFLKSSRETGGIIKKKSLTRFRCLF